MSLATETDLTSVTTIDIGSVLRTEDSRGLKIKPFHEVRITINAEDGTATFSCSPAQALGIAQHIEGWAKKARERNDEDSRARRQAPRA